MSRAFPTQARCVVVGGGIIGSSVAYHVAKLGWDDTVVVERGQLTCGSTVHAAGLDGRETIVRNGEPVGWLSSAGFGHSVNHWIGYGYVLHPDGVTRDFLLQGQYELEVATERIPARVHIGPLYDPKGLKTRS